MARTASLERNTTETKIRCAINLDGSGISSISTGVGFFDHMLTHLAKHGMMDVDVVATGDLHIDSHHTVEDVGIALGLMFAEALGNKAGIQRYGSCTLPMDDTLVTAAVDLSGRPFLVWKADIANETLGIFHSSLAEEFWRAFSSNARINLHVVLHHGHNTHHILEAIFKAIARSLRSATEMDPRSTGIPSTKGTL